MGLVINVVAGIIVDAEQRIFLSLRKKNQHQGGLWEFPGGKRESGESSLQALQRELQEELGIVVNAASHYHTVSHRYPDKEVAIEFWLVDAFNGEPSGLEGQRVGWYTLEQLASVDFPEANKPVVERLLSSGALCN